MCGDGELWIERQPGVCIGGRVRRSSKLGESWELAALLTFMHAVVYSKDPPKIEAALATTVSQMAEPGLPIQLNTSHSAVVGSR